MAALSAKQRDDASSLEELVGRAVELMDRMRLTRR
jgi:hypothetical protein